MSPAAGTSAAMWGQLARPVDGSLAKAGGPPWKDNAYLCFWDDQHDVIGTVHVSTSPNAEGRRARASLAVDGRAVEVVGPLDARTFRSEHVDFALDDEIVVDAPGFRATIRTRPIGSAVDYSTTGVIPALVAGHPLRHFQQAAAVEADVTIDQRSFRLEGHGFRDRSWGFRDESSNMDEYIAWMAVVDDRAITAMRFRERADADRTAGFVISGDEATPVASVGVTRGAAGHVTVADLTLADGSTVSLTTRRDVGGFWVPMGWERRGPTIAAYDTFSRITDERGRSGTAMVEQANVRRIF